MSLTPCQLVMNRISSPRPQLSSRFYQYLSIQPAIIGSCRQSSSGHCINRLAFEPAACLQSRIFDSSLYEKERIALSFRKISMAISRTVGAGRHNRWSCFDIKEDLSSHFGRWSMTLTTESFAKTLARKLLSPEADMILCQPSRV